MLRNSQGRVLNFQNISVWPPLCSVWSSPRKQRRGDAPVLEKATFSDQSALPKCGDQQEGSEGKGECLFSSFLRKLFHCSTASDACWRQEAQKARPIPCLPIYCWIAFVIKKLTTEHLKTVQKAEHMAQIRCKSHSAQLIREKQKTWPTENNVEAGRHHWQLQERAGRAAGRAASPTGHTWRTSDWVTCLMQCQPLHQNQPLAFAALLWRTWPRSLRGWI